MVARNIETLRCVEAAVLRIQIAQLLKAKGVLFMRVMPTVPDLLLAKYVCRPDNAHPVLTVIVLHTEATQYAEMDVRQLKVVRAHSQMGHHVITTRLKSIVIEYRNQYEQQAVSKFKVE